MLLSRVYVCAARGLSRSWDSLLSTGWRARMRSEIMKDGAAGQCLRSTSPVPAEWSVFYKAIRWTRWRLGTGHFPWEPVPSIALPGRVPERVSEKPGYMQIRTPLPHILPLLATAIPFCLLSYGLSPSRISQRYPAVRATPRKEVFPVNTHTYERTCTRTHMLVILLHVISYSFHPSRIDITYSTTSTLKPLSTFSLSRSLDETSESETPRQWRVGNVALIYRLLLYRAIDM